MAIYREWAAMARSAVDHSPDGTRRPHWLKRPLKPVKEAYELPKHPFGRNGGRDPEEGPLATALGREKAPGT